MKLVLTLITTLSMSAAFSKEMRKPSSLEQTECFAAAVPAYKAVYANVLKMKVKNVKVLSTGTAEDGANAQITFRVTGTPENSSNAVESEVRFGTSGDCEFEDFVRYALKKG